MWLVHMPYQFIFIKPSHLIWYVYESIIVFVTLLTSVFVLLILYLNRLDLQQVSKLCVSYRCETASKE